MTDTIRLGAFLLPSAGASIAQYEQGFAGQNPNFYQNTLRDSARLIRQLDDIGFDFVAFSEHHFHLEGLEVSNNPILLGSWAAGLSRKLRIGQMGNVLPARNPLLMAEDLAMLDHFSEGRMMAGFARGYQARHVATIGQKYNAWSTAANDPQYQEHDRTNRELFAEHYRIIRRAWSEPLFRHQGQHWQLPPPGIPWNHPATLAMAPGMVGADGMLQQVGIAPLTLQNPASIETYIPFTMSPATLQWAAQNNVIPILFTPIDELVRGCIDAFQNAALEAGRQLEWGRGLGHFREILIADTDQEAIALMENGLGYVWPRWHHWFGFNEALRHPGEQGEIANTAATVRERGYSLCGSVDTVTRLLEKMLTDLNTDLIVPWISVGPMPIDALLRSNELLVDKVLPRLGVKLGRYQPRLRADVTGPLWRDGVGI